MNRLYCLCLTALSSIGLATASAAEVTEQFVTVHCESPGTLVLSEEALIAPNLKVTGNIDARDFQTLKNVTMAVTNTLDLSEAVISEYTGTEGCGNTPGSNSGWMIRSGSNDITYPANTFPQGAFYAWGNNSISNYTYGTATLTRVILPATLEDFMEGAFNSETLLTDLEVPGGSTTIRKEGNAVYSYDGSRLLCVAPAFFGDLVVPETVTTVAPGAFACARPASVTFTSAVMPEFAEKEKLDAAYIIAPDPTPYQERFSGIDCMAKLDVISVTNTDPGMLITEIGNLGYTRKDVKGVKVKGTLNFDDLQSLLDLSSLHYADLSEAEVIVENYTSLKLTNPALTHLDFPTFTDQFALLIYDSSRLHGDLTVPEEAWSFWNKSIRFRSVVFPSTLGNFGEDSFPYYSVVESIDLSKCTRLQEFRNSALLGRLGSISLSEGLKTFSCYGPVKELDLPESLTWLATGYLLVDKLTLPKSLTYVSLSSLPLIKEIDASRATSLEEFRDLRHAPNLSRLDLSMCPLTEMLSVFGSVSTWSLAVSGGTAYPAPQVNHIQTVSLPPTLRTFNSFTNCPDLKRVDLMQCYRLEEVWGFNDCPSLEYISLPEATRALYGFLNTPSLVEVRSAAAKAPSYTTGLKDEKDIPLDYRNISLAVAKGNAGAYRMAEGWEQCKGIDDNFVRVSVSPEGLAQLGGNPDKALIYGAGLYPTGGEVTLSGPDAGYYALKGWSVDGVETAGNPCKVTPEASVTAIPVYSLDHNLCDIVFTVKAKEETVFPIEISSYERTVFVDGEKYMESPNSNWTSVLYSLGMAPGDHTVAVCGRDVRLDFQKTAGSGSRGEEESSLAYAVTGMTVNNPETLTSLYPYGFDMDVLDLSGCRKLGYISCYIAGNRISKLDVSDCPKLGILCIDDAAIEECNVAGSAITDLRLTKNKLKELDLPTLKELRNLSVSGNSLQSLDLRGLTALETLSAYNNEIGAFSCPDSKVLRRIDLSGNLIEGEVDLSGAAALEEVGLGGNKISSLKLGELPALKILNIYRNSIEGRLDVSGCPNIERVDADNASLTEFIAADNKALRELDLENNRLTGILNVTELENLDYLYVNNNNLSGIELGSKPVMKYLSVAYNEIEGTLDISGCPALITLSAQENKITSLKYGDHPELANLYLGYNSLSFLNVEDFPALENYGCYNQEREMTISEKDFNIDLIKEDGLDINRLSYWHVTWYDSDGQYHYKECSLDGDIVALPEEAGRELTLVYAYLVNPATDLQVNYQIHIVREGFGSVGTLMADGTVTVEGASIVFADGIEGEVYGLSGVCVFKGYGETGALAKGVYIVRVGSSVMKVSIP